MTPDERDTQTQALVLTPERFARIRAVFEAALVRKPSDRAGYVDGACGQDDLLRKEVLRMLAAEAQPDALLDAPTAHPPSSAPEEGRFPAGTNLAGRYRILGMLGHGGMGEVYKAHDLILNQAVALKFLNPTHLSEAALMRFRNEVRIARQVSHPNVCRVYDLGMVEGLHFLSMEYIDGEDLASLLRRIGRLPQDKAIEFTRKICAGLGAAHERGVLHRDLKPANIMIDGRGQPRITDFGLAGLAAEIPLSDIRSGTPAYMSPEQKAGKEVTTRSDIYSLGLVLYEMFTGKQRKDSQSNPTDHVKDLDPAIERLILRCLEEDPKRRPAAPINVAMGLPGADPIAAALAAGETPSPEMVAASQEKEGLTSRAAVLCLVGTILIWSMFPLIGSRVAPLAATLELPPDALAFKAQSVLKDLGYAQKPAQTAHGFEKLNADYERATLERLPREQSIALLATHQPAVASFWYRQHQAPLEALPLGEIEYNAPANDTAGMIRLRLDATGRLILLEARPAQTDTPRTGDWSELFRAAGLDQTRFAAATPQEMPPMPFDARAAFTGTFAEGRTQRVRLEMASWQGRPVYFNLTGDWLPPATSTVVRPAGATVGIVFLVVFFLAAVVLGWHNLHVGRGDRRGALWMGVVVFLASAAEGFVVGSFSSGTDLLTLVTLNLARAAFIGGFAAALYLGIEPMVRRHWPDAMISLTRLQTGRLRDTLVASHLLIGVFASGVIRAPRQLSLAFLEPPYLSNIARLMPAEFAGRFLNLIWGESLVVLGCCLIGAWFRMGAMKLGGKRLWVADLLTVAVLVIPNIVGGQVGAFASNVLGFGAAMWMVRRLGILPFAVSIGVHGIASVVPPILGSFWSSQVILVHALPILIAAWALWIILSTQQKSSSDSASAT